MFDKFIIFLFIVLAYWTIIIMLFIWQNSKIITINSVFLQLPWKYLLNIITLAVGGHLLQTRHNNTNASSRWSTKTTQKHVSEISTFLWWSKHWFFLHFSCSLIVQVLFSQSVLIYLFNNFLHLFLTIGLNLLL